MTHRFELLEYEQVDGEFRRYFKFLNWLGEGDRFAKLYGNLRVSELALALLPENVPLGQEVNDEIETLGVYSPGEKDFLALVLANNKSVVPIMEELLQELESTSGLEAMESTSADIRR